MTKFATIRSGKIHYNTSGDGDPIIFLCTTGNIWANQVRGFESTNHVITYDMRGYGLSENFEDGLPSNEDHAKDLGELIAYLNLKNPIIVALSHGGMVLQWYARKNKNIGAMVLVATPPVAVGQTKVIMQMLRDILNQYGKDLFWDVLKNFLFTEKKLKLIKRKDKKLKEMMYTQLSDEQLARIYSDALEHDATPWLHEISVPCLIIGGIEDILFPPSLMEIFQRNMSGSHLELLECAHLPPVEAEQEFKDTIIHFIETINE